MTPPSKWLFFPTPASSGISGTAIILDGRVRTAIGGVECRVQDDSSTVYNSWSVGYMDFRDASKNASWTDDGLGLLWNMADSTNYANWQGLIGTAGGTFNVYEAGTETLVFSLEWAGEQQWTTNIRQYGKTSRDFTGTTSANEDRVDVYHIPN